MGKGFLRIFLAHEVACWTVDQNRSVEPCCSYEKLLDLLGDAIVAATVLLWACETALGSRLDLRCSSRHAWSSNINWMSKHFHFERKVKGLDWGKVWKKPISMKLSGFLSSITQLCIYLKRMGSSSICFISFSHKLCVVGFFYSCFTDEELWLRMKVIWPRLHAGSTEEP